MTVEQAHENVGQGNTKPGPHPDFSDYIAPPHPAAKPTDTATPKPTEIAKPKPIEQAKKAPAAELPPFKTADIYAALTHPSPAKAEAAKKKGDVKAGQPTKPGDSTDKSTPPGTPPTEVDQARKSLSDAIDKAFTGPNDHPTVDKEYMRLFEERAKADHLDPKQVAETYKQIQRLLEGGGSTNLSPEARKELATDILSKAAYPERAKQGAHETCNVSTVEERVYATDPAAAARMVTDVALTGKYTAPDGTTVQVNPNPHGESHDTGYNRGERDYAGELFQLAAVNLHYAKVNPNLHYEQVEPTPDNPTGERLIDTSKNPPEVVSKDPVLYQPDQAQILETITGKHEKGIFLRPPSPVYEAEYPHEAKETDETTVVKSEADLQKQLEAAKASGQFPLIVAVRPENEPFSSQMSVDPTKLGSGHEVDVSDYNAGPPPTVTVDNPATGDSTTMSVHDLYRSMLFPKDSADVLKKEVDTNRANGKVDYAKEIELLNLQKSSGQIKPDEYSKGVRDIINEIGKDPAKLKEFLADNPQAAHVRQMLEQAVKRTPLEDQSQLLTDEHSSGMLGTGSSNDSNYVKLMSDVGQTIAKIKNDPQSSAWSIMHWLSYHSAESGFKSALATLPPDLQKQILQQVGKSLGIN